MENLIGRKLSMLEWEKLPSDVPKREETPPEGGHLMATALSTEPVFSVFVPGKPVSVNSMYTPGRGRNHYAGRRRTDAAMAWKQAVWAYCYRYRGSRRRHLYEPLRIEIEFVRLRHNADPDNFAKIVLDGVADALGINDKAFSEITLRRAFWIPGQIQGAQITVWEASA